ncbi:hypothetical protein KKC87_04505 [Patescibacteria group bacterium]|nr:hypothetical protein [Patescibacteria group bacterium]
MVREQTKDITVLFLVPFIVFVFLLVVVGLIGDIIESSGIVQPMREMLLTAGVMLAVGFVVKFAKEHFYI